MEADERQKEQGREVIVRARYERNTRHRVKCSMCGQPCDGLNTNQALWPVALSFATDPYTVKWHHAGCVADELELRASRIRELEKELAKLKKK